MEKIIANLGKYFSGVSIPWVKIGLSIATVFIGLVCIVLLCKIIGLFCRGAKNETPAPTETKQTENPGERQQILAAVIAAIAEETGKDVKALRVKSFKKI